MFVTLVYFCNIFSQHRITYRSGMVFFVLTSGLRTKLLTLVNIKVTKWRGRSRENCHWVQSEVEAIVTAFNSQLYYFCVQPFLLETPFGLKAGQWMQTYIYSYIQVYRSVRKFINLVYVGPSLCGTHLSEWVHRGFKSPH